MITFLNKFGIYSILIAALILRLININQSLWLDEAVSALAAKNYSFYAIVFEFIKGDNHPPLFYLLLRAWGLVFGFSDVALRFLPIIFGVLTVWLCYLFLKKQFNQKIGLLGSFLLATSPLHIYYSQEIRMYPILAFWVILSLYIFSFLGQEKTKLWQWIIFSLIIILIAGTDYVGLFFLPVFLGLILVNKVGKNLLKNFILSFIPLGLITLLWLPVFSAQIATAAKQLNGLPGWRELAGGSSIKEVVVLWMKFVLGRISFDPKIAYYGLVGFFSVPILISFYKSRKSTWLWIILLVPLVSSFLFSFIVPAFNYFRFIYVLPAFYGLIAIGILSVKKPGFQSSLIVLVLLGNLVGTGFYFFDQNNQREQWKQATQYIETQKADLTFFEFPAPFDPYIWYSSGAVEGFGATNALTANKELTEQKIENKISSKTQRIMHVSYLWDLTDPDRYMETKLEELGFRKGEGRSFVGVGEVTKYERY